MSCNELPPPILGTTLPGESVLLPLPPGAEAECSLRGSSRLVVRGSAAAAIQSGAIAGGEGSAEDNLRQSLTAVQEMSLDACSTFLFSAAPLLAITVGAAVPPPAAAGPQGDSPGSTMASLRNALVRDTLDDAVVSLSESGTVCVDCSDHPCDASPLAVASGPGRPVALTEEMYEDNSEDDCRSSALASSMGLLSDVSGLADTLAYTHGSSSCAGSTLRSNLLQGSLLHSRGSGSLNNSQGSETVEALRAALANVEVRTPTPPHKADLTPQSELPSLPPLTSGASAHNGLALEQAQLEAFSSAVRGAEGLGKDLQKDLLDLLQSFPTQSSQQ